MFNLEKRERLIILFLTAALLAGLSVMLYKKSSSIVDVKIRSFDYDGAAEGIKKININVTKTPTSVPKNEPQKDFIYFF